MCADAGWLVAKLTLDTDEGAEDQAKCELKSERPFEASQPSCHPRLSVPSRRARRSSSRAISAMTRLARHRVSVTQRELFMTSRRIFKVLEGFNRPKPAVC
jgi:hypothetical protein